MGGIASPNLVPGMAPPVMNPILDEIDAAHARLSPDAQAAIEKAHGIAAPSGIAAPNGPAIEPPPGGGIQAPAPTTVGSGITPPGAESPKLTTPTDNVSSAVIKPPAMSLGSKMPETTPTPIGGKVSPELARLTAPDNHRHDKTNTGTPGDNQIHNPWARVPLQILDALGRGFFPGVEMAIPGTSGHHDVLVHQRQAEDTAERDAQNDEAKRELEAAQTENQESIPELNRAKAEVAQAKQRELETGHRNTEDINRAKNEGAEAVKNSQIDSQLAQHGMKRDPETHEIVPQKYEEMSEPLQAIHDLKAAQSEQAEATAALRKAQAENQPAMAKIAEARLRSAQEAHSIATRRLGLSEMQTEGRLLGTHNGQPLPGSIQTDEGTPVGSAFQQNVRPTGQERNKADMGQSAKEQISDIREIVQRRPDIFGPAAGRKTDFTVWVGSQDPDAQAFRAARTIAGDHLAGTFGGRSETALKELDSAIGHFKDNPAAIVRGLDQIEKANEVFIKRGTPRTTGSHAADTAATGKEHTPIPIPKVGEIRNGYKYKGGDVNQQSSWEKSTEAKK